MESQTPSLPIPDKENADLLGIRRQTWQSTAHKYISTWQTTPPQKAPIPKRAADKKKRTKTPMKRQFQVRMFEKSLPEPEAVATAAASTALVVKQTTTTTKPNPIPMMVYNHAQSKTQEVPNPTKKFQEEESPFTPVVAIPLWCSNPRLPHLQPH